MAASAALRSPAFHAVPHRLEHLAPAQPLVEGGVDGHVEIGGDGHAGPGVHRLAVVARGDEDPGHQLLVVAVGPNDRGDGLDVVGRQPVDDGTVALPPGQAQHALPQGGDQDGHRLGDGQAEPEAVDGERALLLGHLLAARARRGGIAACPGCAGTAARRGCRSSARRSRSTTSRGRARTVRAPPRPTTPPTGPSSAGPRVKAGMMATPRRMDGAQVEARASGVNPSAPSASDDHRSV